MNRRSLLLWTALALFTLSSAGCAWFFLGAVGGITYSVMQEDDEVNLLPAGSITAPASNALVSDRVFVKYTLADPEGENCSIQVRYSLDGGGLWSAASEVRSYPSEGVSGLAASPAGTAHIFVWNSFLDLQDRNFPDAAAGHGTVRVSIVPVDAGGGTGAPFQSASFRLYNGFVSTFFGGELTELVISFPSALHWESGGGTGSDRLTIVDEFQSQALNLDLSSGTTSVVAGTGKAGYTGDNLPADAAGLTNPGKICTDGAGSYFIADTSSHRIRRVDGTSGFITTVAGTGERGYEGDGGSPANAQLSHPKAVEYDATRSILYIADSENDALRAVNLGAAPVSVAGINIQPGTIVTILGDPAGDWTPERDGPAGIPGSNGTYSSHKVDSNGRSHVAYYDETNESLKYVHHDGTRWVIETVDMGEVGEYCALALDPEDRPHISYYDSGNGALKYARHDGTRWSTFTVDSNGDPGYHSTIAVWLNTAPDPDVLHVYIGYVEDEGDELRAAHWNGSYWSIEYVMNGAGRGNSSMAVSSSGVPHFAFYYHDQDELHLYYYSAGSWTPWPLVPWVHNSGGSSCSLVLSPTNTPHIAFYDGNTLNGTCYYTYWTGSNWSGGTPIQVDDGDRGAGAGNEHDVGQYCSLALDSFGRPHVAYYDADTNNGSLVYSVDSNGDGDFLDINEQANYVDGHFSGTWDDVGEWASLALYNGHPRITYVQWEQGWPSSSARLRYAFWVNPPGAFALRLLDSGVTAGIGRPVDLKLDPAGNLFIATQEKAHFLNLGSADITVAGIKVSPSVLRTIAGIPSPMTGVVHVPGTPGLIHAVYSDPTNGKLTYAIAPDQGGLWSREVIPDGSANYGDFPSIAVDSSGDVHVAYYDDEAKNLKYAVKSGVSWTIETPAGATATGIGEYASLALDGNEDPAIAYWDATNRELKYVSRAGSGWGTPEVVDSGGPSDAVVGRFASLAFDNGATPRPGIAYFDDTNQQLKYAYRTGGATPWSILVADSSEPCGKWTSLDYDSGNYFHISYYGHLRKVLKYAHNSATGVQVNVLDAFGDVGRYSRTHIHQGTPDEIFVIYLDASRNRGIVNHYNGSYWQRNDFGHDGVAFPAFAYDGTSQKGYTTYSRPFRTGEVRLQTMDFAGSNWSESTIYSPEMGEQYGGDGRFALNAMFSEINGFELALYGSYGASPPLYDTLIVADSSNSRVRVINLNDPRASSPVSITVANRTVGPGRVDTILGNGDFTYDPSDDGAVVDNVASPVEVAMPQDVTVDSSGNIFVADSVNQRIRVLNTGATPMTWCGVQVAPGAIDTIAGGDTDVSVTASTFYPSGLAVDETNGDVFISDYIGAVFRVNPDTREFTVVAGFGAFGFAGDGGPATDAEFWAPHDVAVDGERNLYILDRGNLRVRAVNLYNTSPTYSICGKTVLQGDIDTILGTGVITYSIDGPGGNLADEYGEAVPATTATVTELMTIAIDRRDPLNGQPNPRGVLYVSDRQNRRVRAVNLNESETITLGITTIAPGNIATVMGSGVALWRNDGPGGTDLTDDFFPGSLPLTVPIAQAGPIALDPSGVLFVMEGDYRVIYAWNTSLSPVNVAGITVAPGVVEHVAGDFFGWQEFNGDGIPALDAQFEEPGFMASWRNATGTTQEIYISDRRHQRIRLIDENGVIGTFVGNGDAGFNGDGVPPANVLVNEPADMAFYETGGKRYIYYVDSRNRRVRWIVK